MAAPTTAARSRWQVKDGSTTNGSSNVGSADPEASARSRRRSPARAASPSPTSQAAPPWRSMDRVGITDSASTTLSSATVSITGHFLLGDTLSVDTTGTNITARYDKVHGALTAVRQRHARQLPDGARPDHLQQHRVRSRWPAASAKSRTISWQVNDGRATNNLSTVVTTSVDVTHIATTVGAGASVVVHARHRLGHRRHQPVGHRRHAQPHHLVTAQITSRPDRPATRWPSMAAIQPASRGLQQHHRGADAFRQPTPWPTTRRHWNRSPTARRPAIATQGGTAPNRTVSWQVTDNQGATSGAATSTVKVLAPHDFSSFPPGTPPPPPPSFWNVHRELAPGRYIRLRHARHRHARLRHLRHRALSGTAHVRPRDVQLQHVRRRDVRPDPRSASAPADRATSIRAAGSAPVSTSAPPSPRRATTSRPLPRRPSRSSPTAPSTIGFDQKRTRTRDGQGASTM